MVGMDVAELDTVKVQAELIVLSEALSLLSDRLGEDRRESDSQHAAAAFARDCVDSAWRNVEQARRALSTY